MGNNVWYMFLRYGRGHTRYVDTISLPEDKAIEYAKKRIKTIPYRSKITQCYIHNGKVGSWKEYFLIGMKNGK